MCFCPHMQRLPGDSEGWRKILENVIAAALVGREGASPSRTATTTCSRVHLRVRERGISAGPQTRVARAMHAKVRGGGSEGAAYACSRACAPALRAGG